MPAFHDIQANVPITLDETDWYMDHEKLADTLDFMAAEGVILTAEQAADVCREGWHFTDYYRAMKAARKVAS
ncbi:MAG TPA: hypothetical protein VFZ00_20515 [Solirubrobacter sp.]|nr:hypothetical protein [Solirubrobacter sp.]